MTMAVALQQDETQETTALPKPLTLADTGLSADTISSLIVKVLHGGEATGMGLADRSKVPYGILEPLLEHLRMEHVVEVKRASGTGSAGYSYALTDAGAERALRYFEACGYVGPAPVPLDQYAAYMAMLR